MTQHPHPMMSDLHFGTDVMSEDGEKIGKVADVTRGRKTWDQRWLVVDFGLFRASRYVPLENAHRSADGCVVVPFTKTSVKHAPRAHWDRFLSRDDEAELCDYYGIAI